MGIERLRITLPLKIPAPKGWGRVKTTRFGRLKSQNLINAKIDCSTIVRQIMRGERLFYEWIDLHRKLYIAKHLDNPANGLTADRSQHVFAGSDLCNNGILAAFDNERMTGISSVRLGEGGLELGWTGFPGGNCLGAHVSIILEACAIAITMGASDLKIEVDDNDLSLMAAAEYLNVTWIESYEIYEKRINILEISGGNV